jgi:hypothetical protein
MTGPRAGGRAIAAVTMVCIASIGMAACSRAGGGTGRSSSITVSSCPAESNDARGVVANLVLTMRTEPAITSDAEATVRVEGPDNYRTDVSVSVAGGSRIELPRGIYDVRISLRGYDGVATRAALTGGCSAEMVATLRRR